MRKKRDKIPWVGKEEYGIILALLRNSTMVMPKRKEAYAVARWDTEETVLARRRMVEAQIVSRGIRDLRVLEAIGEIPRHLFVSEREKLWAYDDGPVSLGFGQTISQPYIVALMTEALGLGGGEKVLEVGTGSGYQAAILSRLAKQVYSIERIGELALQAKDRLAKLEIFNVELICGDGTLGLPEQAPFNAVIVTAAAPDIPGPLVGQLADEGRLVLPVGERWEQTLLKITKRGDALQKEKLGMCAFVPLIGIKGWESSQWD